MKRLCEILVVAMFLVGAALVAQSTLPEIAFDSIDPLKLPDNMYLGEVAGVTSNSKGDLFVYTRTGHPTITIGTSRPFAHGGSRLLQFDKSGKFIREIGQGLYGFLVAQQVRVDPLDNIWVVDQMSNMVIKFDPNGQVQLLLGRKAEAERVPALPLAPPAISGAAGAASDAEGPSGSSRPLPGAGAQSDTFQRPTDVAWDAAGNIYVADGFTNARIAKFDKNGKFIKSWGSRGRSSGQFDVPHGVAVDAQGKVYVADRGNKRIQVFDSNGVFQSEFGNVGSPWALCITPGTHQYLFISDSNPPEDIDNKGQIYKVELNGQVIGRFGKAGKLLKEFGTVNELDCRSDKDLYVGELANWRVQKVTLRPN